MESCERVFSTADGKYVEGGEVTGGKPKGYVSNYNDHCRLMGAVEFSTCTDRFATGLLITYK